jgi:hypothetical protein
VNPRSKGPTSPSGVCRRLLSFKRSLARYSWYNCCSRLFTAARHHGRLVTSRLSYLEGPMLMHFNDHLLAVSGVGVRHVAQASAVGSAPWAAFTCPQVSESPTVCTGHQQRSSPGPRSAQRREPQSSGVGCGGPRAERRAGCHGHGRRDAAVPTGEGRLGQWSTSGLATGPVEPEDSMRSVRSARRPTLDNRTWQRQMKSARL